MKRLLTDNYYPFTDVIKMSQRSVYNYTFIHSFIHSCESDARSIRDNTEHYIRTQRETETEKEKEHKNIATQLIEQTQHTA